jgi:peptide-methionine (S)-S-oxide reductase
MMNQLIRTIAVLAFGCLLACNSVNSSSSSPAPANEADPTPRITVAIPAGHQTAIFAGGCFWGVEAVFEHIKGVKDVRSGYAGGTAKAANYDAVSNGDTRHAEAVNVTFDPGQVSYEQLLEVFFKVAHDPTELDRQGPDVGPQYRSAIFYVDENQKTAAAAYIEKLNAAGVYKKPIVTQVAPLDKFYDAEASHQDYLPRNLDSPYIIYHDLPKLENLKKQFPALYVKK